MDCPPGFEIKKEEEHMIIKNTPKGRRLVKQLSDYLRNTTPYFRPMVDKGWNCGEDIRFEIASVGDDSPVIISTAYTPAGGFWFKVRLLSNQIEDPYTLMLLSHRLAASETVLIHMKSMVEEAQPEISDYAA